MNLSLVFKRDYAPAKRKDLAKEGKALPDGSFPIVTVADLKNAISSYGRSKDPAAAKTHIIARARDLDAIDQLPPDWKVKKHEDLSFIVLKDGDQDEHMVYAEVYAPDIPDSDGEYMTAEEIKKMAHNFIRSGRMSEVDMQHDGKDVEGAIVVESFIARKEDTLFIPGSWVVGMHIDNDDVWQMIKNNEINGFSMEAMVTKEVQETVDLDVPPIISGLTTKQEEHEHKFYVSYDENGMFKGGVTDIVNGHMHTIRTGTITEKSENHRHQFCAVDDLRISR